MKASTADINQSGDRLREYQRQQEKLKAMNMNADKVKSMSADVMIENLLKQNFVKPNNASSEKKSSILGLPNWLDCESAEVPMPYKLMWSLVKTTNNFADTQKVSLLLLTSGLQTEVLGFIWNLANKTIPGQLNKQEFYIILALVALAQSGYTYNNLSILNFIPSAPIPALQTKVLEKCGFTQVTPGVSCINEISHIKPVHEEILKSQTTRHNGHFIFGSIGYPSNVNESIKDSLEVKQTKKASKLSSSREFSNSDNIRDFPKMSNFPFIGSSPTAELEDDDFSEFQSVSVSEPVLEININKEDSKVTSQSDEFTDFQCADVSDSLETIVISQKKEIPKIPLPKNLTGKISSLRTNIIKISPESEKKLKVLSQSETLSSLPESKISSNNKVSTMPNISVIGGRRDIGMRLANHSLGSKTEKIKHQRHHKHKQPTVSDEMLFQSKFGPIDEIFPKCFQKSSTSSKTFVLKETKIGKVDSLEHDHSFKSDSDLACHAYTSGKNTRRIEIPMLGTFNETTLPTQAENLNQSRELAIELFSIEEDKYSALREVEMEMKLKAIETVETNLNALDGADDFGEFLSAEIPSSAPAEDLWGDWNNSDLKPKDDDEPVEAVSDSNNIKTENVFNATENNDEKKNLDQTSALNLDLLNLDEEVSSKVFESVLESKISGDEKEDTLILNNKPLEPKKKKCLEDFEDFIMLDNLKTDDVNYFTSDAHLETPITTGINEKLLNSEHFGMFFTSECNQSSSDLNVEDSLPSLDLKFSSSESSAQEIRRKCLTACRNLMQEALDIFSGVSSPIILQEVFSTQEAVNYLNNLNIIRQISRRTISNCFEVSSIQEDLERVWDKLMTYCIDYNIALKKETDFDTPMGAQCRVCLSLTGKETIEQGINSYHPSCANFWINCIDSELPCPN